MTDIQPTMFGVIPGAIERRAVHHGGTEAAREAVRQLIEEGKFSDSYIRVLRWIWRWPDCTYRQLTEHARGIGERCAEQEPARRYAALREAGLIVESDRVRCPIGGRNCSTYRATERGVEFLRTLDGGK